MALADSLLAVCREDVLSHLEDNRTFWLGYSGGLDSTVLLDLLMRLQDERPFQLNVVHINHQIYSEAAEWQAHCEAIAASYGISCQSELVTLSLMPGDSLEAAARKARYAVFERLMKTGDILLTAHHQDDQAETVLLQLIRGAGVNGLAAMPRGKAIAGFYHARPLLDFSRTTLEAYAQANQLRWMDDHSNKNERFARNFIRHTVLPLLKTRWPSVGETVSRSASHCAEVAELVDSLLAEKLPEVYGTSPETLSVAKLLRQSRPLQGLLLRAWIVKQGAPLPDTNKINTILAEVANAAHDRMPVVSWQSVSCRRFNGDLILFMQGQACHALIEMKWQLDLPLSLPSIGLLELGQGAGRGLTGKLSEVTVRFRQGGEKIKKGGVSQSLKKLFQVWRIPPWERDRIPLLYAGEELVAVASYHVHDDYQAAPHECARNIIFTQEKRTT